MARNRSIKNALVHLLAASPLPVYLVDDQRRIVYCNPACGEWVGVDVEQLAGRRCDYHSSCSPGTPEEIAAGLCPPPEVFSGRRITAEVACRVAPDSLVRRRAEFLPLGRDAVECSGVLVVVGGSPPGETESVECDAAELHHRLRTFRQSIGARRQIHQLMGDSPAMRRVRDQVWIAAEHRTRVLVLGPAGSGREHVARTIHYGGQPESAGPLAPLSCSLLDAELLRGTITAFLRQCAELETETPAALLLLDVDELAPDAQAVLADVMNIAEFDLRALATARTGLLQEASEGRFRHDLACALSTLVIELPSLAERRQDIPLLAQFLLEEANAEGGRQLSGFTPEAMDQLVAHPWRRNMDEMAELLREACQQAEGPVVTTDDLPEQVRWSAQAAAHPRRVEETIVLDDFLAEIETELISRALRHSKGNKAKAARLLGITRARLHRRIVQLKLG